MLPMLPAAYPLALTRGDTFAFGLCLLAGGVPADLTGCALRLQIRFAVPGGTFLAPEPAAGGLIHPSASLAAGPAPAGATALRVGAPAADTELWPVGVHLYDAEVTTPAGARTTYLLCPFDLAGDVSKP